MSKIKAGTTTTTAYQVEADTTGTLVLQTGATPTTAMTIDGSQNVGVGTSSPVKRLQLGNNSVTSEMIRFANTTANFDIGMTTSGCEITTGNNQPIIFTNNAAERMRIDTSGNVGIGFTPSAWYSGWKALQGSSASFAVASAGQGMYVANNTYLDTAGNWKYSTSDYASYYQQYGGAHRLYYAASGTAGNTVSFTQGMMLDINGGLRVGVAGAISYSDAFERFSVSGPGTAAVFRGYGNTYPAIVVQHNYGSGTQTYMYWVYNGTATGSISSSGSTTVYSTSSDYRLKENIQPLIGALSKVMQLNPVSYTWKESGESDEGFIAHELQEVCPSAVTGEKDAVNEDGSIKPQGIDTSFLVATLTAAIQELKAELDAAKADIATLKGA